MTPNDADDIVRLVTAPNPVLAHIWEQALTEEGIACKVVGDFLEAGGYGDIPGVQPELWVHRRDVDRAEEVLRNSQQAVSDEDLEAEGKPALPKERPAEESETLE